MNEEIEKAFNEFKSVLIEELGSNTVAVELFISHSEISYNVQIKSPAALKSDGISMKNIKGEWIK
jgi:hypothetical protein